MITFISDRGKGLVKAFDKIFPDNPHLFCYYHLTDNLAARYTGKGSANKRKAVVNAFYECAYSSTEREYYHNLRALRTEGGYEVIDDFLKDLPLKHWCRAFGLGCRFGIMSNTIAESFNSWICVERSMPVYTMLEEVRLKQMRLINERRTASDGWTTRLTPAMEKKLKDEMAKSLRFRPIKASGNLYEVKDVFSYEVDLNAFTCSCVKWQINSFPCPHALSAISASRRDVYDFIHPVHFVDEYCQAYEIPINPVSNVEEPMFESNGDFILPPLIKNHPGRRRNKRFKSNAESGFKKKRICGRCGKKCFHNKLTCTDPILGS